MLNIYKGDDFMAVKKSDRFTKEKINQNIRGVEFPVEKFIYEGKKMTLLVLPLGMIFFPEAMISPSMTYWEKLPKRRTR